MRITCPSPNKVSEIKYNAFKLLILIAMGFWLTACASQPKNEIMLMPAPDVYDQGYWDPFSDQNPIENIPYGGILYATDRKPSQEEGQYYMDDRGGVLRLGVARITAGMEGMTWDEARHISLLKERPEDYPLKVSNIKELGIMDRSINRLTQIGIDDPEPLLAENDFATKINEKLAISKNREICIYVHGYKVVFENPLLVASELWHFLGYDGAFIAYAWPSTPKTTAYFSDLETGALSAGNLRLMIQYLAEKTDAEKINIIGYSAGTRIVTQALYQLALMRLNPDCKTAAEDLRIGHVILTGSDIDLHLFGAYLADGLLDMTDDFTVYASSEDKALGMSKFVFGRRRLGQTVNGTLGKAGTDFIHHYKKLIIINATDTPGATSGNGHAYFRQSPWTSSDILATLMFDLKPETRGLERLNDQPIWTFSQDYITKLRDALSGISH